MIILPIVSDHIPSQEAFPVFYLDYSASKPTAGAKLGFSYKCRSGKSHWEFHRPRKDSVWVFLTGTVDGYTR